MLRDEAVTVWIKFFIWKNFTSTFNIDSYLSYHNYTSDHIYRNILLKQINCFTIMYKHTHSENVFDYVQRQKRKGKPDKFLTVKGRGLMKRRQLDPPIWRDFKVEYMHPEKIISMTMSCPKIILDRFNLS